MKIAFLHPAFSNSVVDESVGIIINETTRRLAKYCDVVVYWKRGRHEKESELCQGVLYRRISSSLDVIFAYLGAAVLYRLNGYYNFRYPFFASRLSNFMFGLRVAQDLRLQNCDIVHVHNYSQFVPIIRFFNPKIKIVLHTHNEWLMQLKQTMIENRLKHVDLIIGCSEFVTEQVRRRFPQYAERCRTVFNGVDVFIPKKNKEMPKKKEIKQLLFVGRVSPEKGVHVLLKAFQKVITHYPQTHLNIVGKHHSLGPQYFIRLSDDPSIPELKNFYKGNYVSHLRSMLSQNSTSHVSFTGSVSREQLVKLYQNASVFVFPSIWKEPFGMPVIEAMSAGVPVVSTLGGGLAEIVKDGETGLLVEQGNASALAEAILRILPDEDLRKSMAAAARKRVVELFSWEKIVEDLLNYYKKLYED